VTAIETLSTQPAASAGDRVTTGGGVELLVRPIEPADRRLIADGFQRLSERSRYRRFFRPVDRLSERDLAYLTEIDHIDHEALAGVHPETGELIGVARYVRLDEPGVAEVSVVVGDPWQRRGVATALLERLTERARSAGIRKFVALVMDENTEAIKLAEHRMPGARPRRSKSGHLELLIDLPEPGRVSESTLGRVLRSVARSAIVVNPYRVTRETIRRVRGE
jgi:RimJ/RimL family protein N-acetyltransferase